MYFLLVLLALAGCSVQTQTPDEILLSVSAPLEDPRITVYVSREMSTIDQEPVRAALTTINAVAYLFREVTTREDAAIIVEYSTTLEPYVMALAQGDHIWVSPWEMSYARRTGRAEAVFVHEAMHHCGWVAVDGSAHDAPGSIMSESIEPLYMKMGPEHIAFLQNLEAEMWN